MIARPPIIVVAAAAAAVACTAGARASESEALYDPVGDRVVRRTDPGNDGPINPLGTLPDVTKLTICGWQPDVPSVDPYTGTIVDPEQAEILRLDVVFDGLVNPPGTLGLGAQPFMPYEFGPSPVYGYVEFDVDRDRDTGGELSSAAALRYFANLGRFGEVADGSSSSKQVFDGAEIDGDFYTPPYYERSGADYALVLCGCFEVTPEETFGDSDGSFDSGDQWIVSGRFFQRAGGFEAASAAFGGSFFGLYDPVVDLRFSHDPIADETTITLVYPLTMQGAADLRGEPIQPIDLDVSNHNSVVEALDDIIDGAEGSLFGPTQILTSEWAGESPHEHTDVTHWRVYAIFGTTYSSVESDLYVWTDAIGEHKYGDYDGSGVVDAIDEMAVQNEIDARDGGPSDADGEMDGVVTLFDVATGFSVFDHNADGLIDAADVASLPIPCDGDADGDGSVAITDISYVIFRLGNSGSPGSVDGDADGNGEVTIADISYVIFRLGSCPS